MPKDSPVTIKIFEEERPYVIKAGLCSIATYALALLEVFVKFNERYNKLNLADDLLIRLQTLASNNAEIIKIVKEEII